MGITPHSARGKSVEKRGRVMARIFPRFSHRLHKRAELFTFSQARSQQYCYGENRKNPKTVFCPELFFAQNRTFPTWQKPDISILA
jgi:hypothetical protein